jgi:hypothetical protein
MSVHSIALQKHSFQINTSCIPKQLKGNWKLTCFNTDCSSSDQDKICGFVMMIYHINIAITILDIVHCLLFKIRCFELDWQLALTSPTSGGRSVGIVRSRTQTTEFSLVWFSRLTKPEGKRPLGRPRRRWVYNIRMDLGEVGWGDVDFDWSG